MSTQPMTFPSGWSERMAYERAKAGYWPYDIEDLRHFCALRDLRIEELKADNAKLREERDHWHVEQVHAYGNWEDAHKRAAELEEQNARLRELVLRFRNHTARCTNYTDNFGYGDCALGPFPDGGGCGNCRHVMCGDMYRNDLDKQLRELGVVDE